MADRIDFEIRESEQLKRILRFQKKSYFNAPKNLKIHQGKISKQLGKRESFYIKQPRSRSQYQYQRPITA